LGNTDTNFFGKILASSYFKITGGSTDAGAEKEREHFLPHPENGNKDSKSWPSMLSFIVESWGNTPMGPNG
jgi:hypothetical protein